MMYDACSDEWNFQRGKRKFDQSISDSRRNELFIYWFLQFYVFVFFMSAPKNSTRKSALVVTRLTIFRWIIFSILI